MKARGWLTWIWPAEPPTPSEWRTLLLLGTAFLVSRYDFALMTLALPDIQADLAVSEAALGSMLGFTRLGAIAAVGLALLADRFGRRRLLLMTILGFSLTSALSALAPNAEVFVGLQFAARAFTSADELLSVVVVVEEIALIRRGWAVGFLAAMGGLGDGLAAALYPFSDVLPGGWRALYALAVLPLLGLTYARRSLNETKLYRRTVGELDSGWNAIRSAVVRLRGRFAALLAVSFCFHLPLSAMLGFMSKYLQAVHNYTPLDVSFLFIAAGGVALLGNLVGGSVADRIGRRLSFAIFCTSMSIGFWGFYSVSVSLVAVFWVLGLFSFLACHATFLAIASESFPTQSRATVSTVAFAVGAFASSIGLFLQSWLYGIYGSHETAIVTLLPALPAAAVLLYAGLPETANKPVRD